MVHSHSNSNENSKSRSVQFFTTRRVCLSIVLMVGLFAAWYFFRKVEQRGAGAGIDRPSTVLTGTKGRSVLRPEATVIGSTEVFYQLPSTDSKGILVFFHGCNHSGQDFFYLPEDRVVARAALDRGLAVLSISSSSRFSGCWSRSEDLMDLKKIFDIWLHSQNLSKSLPIIGMGASSGGAILFHAYKILHFKAMASYIMWRSYSPNDLLVPDNLPATAYVYMPRDERSHDEIRNQIEPSLNSLGIRTRVWSVLPHPLTPHTCAERIPEMGLERCTSFLDTVKGNSEQQQQQMQHQPLNHNYTVLEPFTSGSWDSYFIQAAFDPPKKEQSTSKSKKKNRGNISDQAFDGHSWLWASMIEEIAVSYGQHEMTAEHCNEVLDWLMKQSGIL